MKRILLLVLLSCAGCVTPRGSDTPVPEPIANNDSDGVAAEDANKAIAGSVTGSEVWLGRLNRGSEWSIDNLHNITTRLGYDNQPAFVANGSGVYYTSIRDGAQADVYLYEESIGGAFRYTSTPQSEFSPTALPVGRGISVVRVETDGRQGLWSYSGNSARQLAPTVDNVGYYTWLDAETVAMFLVTEPPTLALANVGGGQIRTIDAQPGRSLAEIPGTGTLSFVDKSNENVWWISRFDSNTGKIQRIAPTLEGSEDFAWTPDGQLLMAQGMKIYVWREQWDLAVDLDGTIGGDITRLVIGPRGEQIVFVTTEGRR